MAITRLMHMKEAPHYKPQHLVNAIKYVLDVRNDGVKTDFGKWVGGNAGLSHTDVIESFLNTKKELQKESGRQGYHFVISFPPGETDAQTCYNVIQDFCQEYLGDGYDYVFAVHTDQDHMHGHVIFNSVSKESGYKYRYEKGDWEKSIQPITDKICQQYGLAPLTIEKEKTGLSYAAWSEQKKGTINWKHIMRADVDCAIHHATDVEDFLAKMKQMNYKLEARGYSKKHNSKYITFKYTDEKGVEHRHRSYALTTGKGDSYNLEAITRRIEEKKLEEPYHLELANSIEQKVNLRLGQISTNMKSTNTYRRMYQAVSYYKLPNPFKENYRTVRRDILRLEKLIEDCAYIKRNPLMKSSGFQKRLEVVDVILKELYILRKSLQVIDEDLKKNVLPSDISRYRQLAKIMSEANEFNDEWEQAEDELEDMEKRLPVAWIENEKSLHRCNKNIEIMKKEKRILERVIKTEGGTSVQKEPEIHMVPGHK